MKTTKLMTANRKQDGNTRLEVFGDISRITFTADGKGHDVTLEIPTADFEQAAVKTIAASPHYKRLTSQMAQYQAKAEKAQAEAEAKPDAVIE